MTTTETTPRAGMLSGIATVARQEFRVRLRTGRWRWLLLAWFLVIAAFSVLLRLALAVPEFDEGPTGIPLFGSVMLFVLGLAMLVAPALTAQSINGDRERGTLAPVQVTRLTPAEIVLGKLVAAWGTALVFIALTVPFVVWAILEGGVGIVRAVVVLLIVSLLVGVICAVAQGLSALFARGITATLMAFLLVFALSAGTLITFGLATVLTSREETISYEVPATDNMGYPIPGGPSTVETYTTTVPHPEYVWWLLAPNPFVVLADSAPDPPLRFNQYSRRMEPDTRLDPLGAIGEGVRETRLPPQVTYSEDGARREGGAVWPWGLAFDVLLGAGSVWISIRRLRTPIRRPSPGVRIA
ncbi:ABC transporter permease [Saccharopolyspora taberi]|uniref:ABC transporter permease subunit n=1 Tax=Saccharopolyspora taberi TaxID=60895 RepID=A0ABN3VHF0_9PSEU